MSMNVPGWIPGARRWAVSAGRAAFAMTLCALFHRYPYGFRTRSEHSTTSDASLPAVHVSPKSWKLVRPAGSRQAYQTAVHHRRVHSGHSRGGR
jgi:hypothetical protein